MQQHVSYFVAYFW